MINAKSTTAIMDTQDWNLCFLCQLQKRNEQVLDPSSSVKWRNKPEKHYACYKEVTDNMQELKELGNFPNCVVVNDISRGGGNGGDAEDVVQLMISKPGARHKSCRNAIESENLESKKKA